MARDVLSRADVSTRSGLRLSARSCSRWRRSTSFSEALQIRVIWLVGCLPWASLTIIALRLKTRRLRLAIDPQSSLLYYHEIGITLNLCDSVRRRAAGE